MNVSIEDYLRTIYSIFEQSGNESIRSVDIAKSLGVSRASVSAMVRRLTDEGYIVAEKYSKNLLTELGEREARRITHRHRVIEVFLLDVLGHDVKTVHEEAHRLEHAFSDQSIQKIDALLKKPGISPSGQRTPRKKGTVAIMNVTLDRMEKGQQGRIIKVSGRGDVHRRLLDMGVVNGTMIRIEGKAPLGDPIQVKVKDYLLSLRMEEAKHIEVAIE
ncbi:MAG: metal-dependent transcriptional regulator [archaeon]